MRSLDRETDLGSCSAAHRPFSGVLLTRSADCPRRGASVRGARRHTIESRAQFSTFCRVSAVSAWPVLMGRTAPRYILPTARDRAPGTPVASAPSDADATAVSRQAQETTSTRRPRLVIAVCSNRVHHALERTITESSARFAVPDPGHDAMIEADHCCLPLCHLPFGQAPCKRSARHVASPV